MSEVELRVHLPADLAEHLRDLAEARQVSEDAVIEKALDILFRVTDLLDSPGERLGWSSLSESSLQRVWDNVEDAVYDNWQELYGVPPR